MLKHAVAWLCCAHKSDCVPKNPVFVSSYGLHLYFVGNTAGCSFGFEDSQEQISAVTLLFARVNMWGVLGCSQLWNLTVPWWNNLSHEKSVIWVLSLHFFLHAYLTDKGKKQNFLQGLVLSAETDLNIGSEVNFEVLPKWLKVTCGPVQVLPYSGKELFKGRSCPHFCCFIILHLLLFCSSLLCKSWCYYGLIFSSSFVLRSWS